MSSINFNSAANSALRTLQQTNTALNITQSRISTGLAISEAKDNAAYWSISTTLKSDNKSMSTVSDALGLGSATVDTAYQGLNAAKDVLDEIKSKLTAATQDGVNKDTIQKEIVELQKQLKSIAGSSVFSGENWLSVDTSSSSYTSQKTVVASFARTASGSVSIGTIGIDIGTVALFDNSSAAGAGGIVNGAVSLKGTDGRNLAIGGTSTATGNQGTGGLAGRDVTGILAAGSAGSNTATGTANTAATAVAGDGANAGRVTTDTVSLTGVTNGDTINFKIKVNGGAEQTVSVLKTSGITDGSTLATALQARFAALGITGVTVANSSNALQFTTAGITSGSTFQLTDVVVNDASGLAKNGATTGLLGTDANWRAGTTASATAAPAQALVRSISEVYTSAALTWTDLAADDVLTLDLSIDGQSVKVSAAAGANLAAFVNNLNSNGSFAAFAKASNPSTALVITSGTTGASSDVTFNSITIRDKDGVVKTPTTTGFEKVGQNAVASTVAFTTIQLDADDNVMFDVKLNDQTAGKTVTIDKALIDKTLGATANGKIAAVADYKKVVEAALQAAGVTGLSTTVNGNVLDFKTTTAAGTNAKITLTNVGASGGGSQISVDKIDISSAKLSSLGATDAAKVRQVLNAYIDVVNSAITKVTEAASNLGSVSARIDLQKTFVQNLMDTIDKGVSGLVDADMNEESTKLQALQVKQQLGVQALSIANQSAQSVLSLFRS